MASRIVDDVDNQNWSKYKCNHPEHDPPGMIPAGKKLIHECPGCGQVVVIHSNVYMI